MNKRENVLRALRRDMPESVPFEFSLCPSQVEAFEQRFGTPDYRAYFDFPVRYINIKPSEHINDYTPFYKNVKVKYEPLSWNAEWGIMGVRGSTAHFQHMLHPMQGFVDSDEIWQYPFPDVLADYRWSDLTDRNAEWQTKGYATCVGMQMTIFELSWYLRGMEEFMAGFYDDDGFNTVLMDRITDVRIQMAARYAAAGVDILQLGDDVSTQLDMMISPELWRRELKPRMARIVAAAKSVKPDILVFYHGDGNLFKIIPDLIEIGIDVLNPVQPECVDPYEVKRLFGDRLSLWGCLGTQTTMPFGTPDEVMDVCRRLIETVGAGGGLLLAPTHVLEPEVPFENVEAFLNAIELYGRY